MTGGLKAMIDPSRPITNSAPQGDLSLLSRSGVDLIFDKAK